MLGKNVKIEVFGTLAENTLYTGFIVGRFRSDMRSVYIMTNHPIEGTVDCTIIAIASAQNRNQTRLVAAPANEIFYEPDIKLRLSKVSVRFEKLICMYEKSCGAVVYRVTRSEGVRILLVKNHNGNAGRFQRDILSLMNPKNRLLFAR